MEIDSFGTIIISRWETETVKVKILARKFDQNKMTVDTVLPTCQEEASDA